MVLAVVALLFSELAIVAASITPLLWLGTRYVQGYDPLPSLIAFGRMSSAHSDKCEGYFDSELIKFVPRLFLAAISPDMHAQNYVPAPRFTLD